MAEAVYGSQYPDSASDQSLDNVMALTGAAQAKIIAYYDFEGDTLDVSGNDNHGTNNGISFSTDVAGIILGHSTRSGSFNGSDAWVDLGYLGIYDKAQAGGVSFSFWVKAADSTVGWMIAEGSDTDGHTAYVFGGHDFSRTGVTAYIRDDSASAVPTAG